MSFKALLESALPAPLWNRLRDLKRTARDLRISIIRTNQLSELAYQTHLRHLFLEKKIDLVVDAGARIGHYAKFIRNDLRYRGRILSFEPNPETFHQLEKASQSDPLWSVYRVGLGRNKGVLPFHVTEGDYMSSFLAPKQDNALADLTAVQKVIEVEITPLDDLIDLGSFSNLFLKLDTQGYDLEVIRGAEKLLGKTEVLQTELSMIPTYEHMPEFQEMLDVLRTMDFFPSGFYPVTMMGGRALELDGLFVRGSSVAGRAYPYSRIFPD